jgi:hypothetical protein
VLCDLADPPLPPSYGLAHLCTEKITVGCTVISNDASIANPPRSLSSAVPVRNGPAETLIPSANAKALRPLFNLDETSYPPKPVAATGCASISVVPKISVS